jgi:hypothetical protein
MKWALEIFARSRNCCLSALILVPIVSCDAGALAAGQASVVCDPGLQPAGGAEVGYADRGDRCEGLYVQEVSGGSLDIVSLTESSADYKFAKENPLAIAWPVLGDTDVRLRAFGLRRKLYYRMDSLRPSKESKYVWPTEILTRLDLSRAELGMLGWTEYPVSGQKRRIYVPLRVAEQTRVPDQSAGADNHHPPLAYTVVLISSVELQEVYVSLTALNRQGRPSKPLLVNSELGNGYYPADRPIRFQIPFSELVGAESGLYSLSVGADLKNGDPEHAPDLWFYHRGTTGSHLDGAGITQ